mmetsp:Transcript_3223/g.5208  ORF Transcript_3223/g.5208 Transcript_3223/m.5208 type:complete len:252 (-) Transcript_3223:1059-1814(-)
MLPSINISFHVIIQEWIGFCVGRWPHHDRDILVRLWQVRCRNGLSPLLVDVAVHFLVCAQELFRRLQDSVETFFLSLFPIQLGLFRLVLEYLLHSGNVPALFRLGSHCGILLFRKCRLTQVESTLPPGLLLDFLARLPGLMSLVLVRVSQQLRSPQIRLQTSLLVQAVVCEAGGLVNFCFQGIKRLSGVFLALRNLLLLFPKLALLVQVGLVLVAERKLPRRGRSEDLLALFTSLTRIWLSIIFQNIKVWK